MVKHLPSYLSFFALFFSEMLLSPSSKITVHEGGPSNVADVNSHNAGKAIYNLVTKLSEKDLLIVLCSGEFSYFSISLSFLIKHLKGKSCQTMEVLIANL